MKKYRVREGSIFDYFRYGFTGLVFGLILAVITNAAYPI